ncbi:MAG: rhodanese-like domain-containing protein [Cyclobacteriaceae bacterium]
MAEDITPQQLKDRITQGETLNLLDVREPWEYEEKRICDLNIPLGTLPTSLDQIQDWKEQELIVYCRSGQRSGQAKKFLEQQGYTQVRNLLEGIEGYNALV